jgi:hypothetical protein
MTAPDRWAERARELLTHWLGTSCDEQILASALEHAYTQGRLDSHTEHERLCCLSARPIEPPPSPIAAAEAGE